MFGLKLFLLSFIFFISSNSYSQKKLPVMIVGYNIVPPFTDQVDGKAVGSANEYLRVMAKDLGVELQFKYMPLARLHKELEENKIDCASLLGPEGDRKYEILPEFYFSEFSPGILVKKDFPVKKITGPKDISGYTFGTKIKMPLTKTMSGTNYKMTYIGGKSPLQNNIKKMIKGRLDGVFSPSIGELLHMANMQGMGEKVRPLLLPDETWKLYVVFSRNGAKKYLKKYNKVHREFRKKLPYGKFKKDYLKKLKK